MARLEAGRLMATATVLLFLVLFALGAYAAINAYLGPDRDLDQRWAPGDDRWLLP